MSIDLESLIERSEMPMLGLAALTILLYLVELTGWIEAHGLEHGMRLLTLCLDGVFVVDLAFKIGVMRLRYLATPWALIDIVSTLPILATLATLPRFLASLRFVRGFRLFRVLRSLRSLRTLRALRGVDLMRHEAEREADTPELRVFHRALTLAVLGYTAVFVGLMYVSEGDADAELHLVLGAVLGMGVVLVVVRYQMMEASSRQVRELLNIALPVQVAEHFLRHPDVVEHTVSAPATISFTDFVRFTDTVGQMHGDLDLLKLHLESSMDAIVEAHVRWDLIVDKFIGDAVMSFRGGDLVSGTAQEHAWRVVRASIEATRALAALDDPYFKRVKVGGASADAALIGTFGTSQRLSYTVLGDRVNLAARLESGCARVGASNLFCENTRALLDGRADLRWRRVGRLKLAGVEEPQAVFEVFDATDADPAWLERFEEGLSLFEQGRLVEARPVFEQTDADRAGGDPPSQAYARECDALLAAGGPPQGFTGVLEARK